MLIGKKRRILKNCKEKRRELLLEEEEFRNGDGITLGIIFNLYFRMMYNLGNQI